MGPHYNSSLFCVTCFFEVFYNRILNKSTIVNLENRCQSKPRSSKHLVKTGKRKVEKMAHNLAPNKKETTIELLDSLLKINNNEHDFKSDMDGTEYSGISLLSNTGHVDGHGGYGRLRNYELYRNKKQNNKNNKLNGNNHNNHNNNNNNNNDNNNGKRKVCASQKKKEAVGTLTPMANVDTIPAAATTTATTNVHVKETLGALSSSPYYQYRWVVCDDKNNIIMFIDEESSMKLYYIQAGETMKYINCSDYCCYQVTKINQTCAEQRNLLTNARGYIHATIVPILSVTQQAGQIPLNNININSYNHYVAIHKWIVYIKEQFLLTMDENKFECLSISPIFDVANTVLQTYHAILDGKRKEYCSANAIATNDKSNLELTLFHGTSYDNFEKIKLNGFNRNFDTKRTYGKGAYFSKYARYCYPQCGSINNNNNNNNNEDQSIKFMLACSVMITDYCVGDETMNKAPFKADGKTQYETMVDDIYDPTIYVITKDYHALPSYLILFRHRN